MNIDVDGVSEKYLNTALKGDVTKIDYNGYTYTNVVVVVILKHLVTKDKFQLMILI
jgi:hypothetical protein